ncbi:isoleucine--tRNA ligase [candidate division KSB1 bacterium]|nr:isoleucine--tRNA ligase [candidate division KSB1 bacterium]
MYKKLPSQVNYPELEKEILSFWKKNETFKRSVDERPEDNQFIFYEGPPTANGKPGVHHVISRTIKDLICRFKTMQGYRVERKAGWDTHGLPVEIEVEKELKLDSKEKIIEYGIDKFNEKCRKSVFRYKKDWDYLTERIGFWLDLDNPYITYKNEYVETVWWILDNFFKRDLIYKGYKILPYCPRCGTPLSSHEVSLGYKDVTDPTVYVKMKVKGLADTYFLVWTTTPWTLISNVALAVNPELEYVFAKTADATYILVSERRDVIKENYEIVKTCKGSELLDMEYEQIFPFKKADKRAFFVISGDFVSTKEGTGIVHIAPAFGEDDFTAGKKFDLPFFQPVDEKGRFTSEITPYKDLNVKDADPKIIKDLESSGILYYSEDYEHNYPHCWRCETPLLYYARQSWYIKTTKFKDRLLANNTKVKWVPKEVGEKRFHRWLENNVDWSLSRDRFWGTPLNIWICKKCNALDSVDSIETLAKRSRNPLPENLDLHKPYIDDVVLQCRECGGDMKRTPEVIDCWFDSGCMPYAQLHYPFENKDKFEIHYPADFICEGVDQTRGWFYSLMAISVLLFDKPAYMSCLTNDLILDKDGVKMSKTKGNVVDPNDVLEKEGADALRWYLVSGSPPWVPTKFDRELVKEVIKKFFGTLVNTYSFFATYANIDEFSYNEENTIPAEDRPEIDKWILSLLSQLVESVNLHMENYDITKASRAISEFVIDDLSNWYVRLNRRRFWKSEKGSDKDAAYQTLYQSLITVTKLMAPFAPFLSEEIFRNLNKSSEAQNGQDTSVHLERYPVTGDPWFQFKDDSLIKRMRQIRRVCFLVRSLRNKASIKIRQPLAGIIVVPRDETQKSQIENGIAFIKGEVNIKQISFVPDNSSLVLKVAKPNFKLLGPKLGKDIQPAKEIIANLSEDDLAEFEEKNQLTIRVNGKSYILNEGDLEIVSEDRPNLLIAEDNGLTVGIDTKLTPDLLREGFAREFVNRVQNMRKEANFEIVDRIRIYLEASNDINDLIKQEEEYITSETLTSEISTEFDPGEFEQTFEFESGSARIGIERINK